MSKEIPKNLKPRQMWLVIYECRYNVIVVSPDGKGFFAPGQDALWGLDNIQEWIREIPEVRYLQYFQAPKEFQFFVRSKMGLMSMDYNYLSIEDKQKIETLYEEYMKENN